LVAETVADDAAGDVEGLEDGPAEEEDEEAPESIAGTDARSASDFIEDGGAEVQSLQGLGASETGVAPEKAGDDATRGADEDHAPCEAAKDEATSCASELGNETSTDSAVEGTDLGSVEAEPPVAPSLAAALDVAESLRAAEPPLVSLVMASGADAAMPKPAVAEAPRAPLELGPATLPSEEAKEPEESLAGADVERRRKRDSVKRAASRFLSGISRRFGTEEEATPRAPASPPASPPAMAEPAMARMEPAQAFPTSFLAPSPSVLKGSRQRSLSLAKSCSVNGASFADAKMHTFTEGSAAKRGTSRDSGAYDKLLQAQTMGRMVHHSKRRKSRRAPSMS